MKLLFGWKFRLKLYAEGNKLRVECEKLWAKGDKLRAEGDKLWAEGDKLRAEGDRLWAELILDTYGNIKLEWKNWSNEYGSYECHLENGEVYGFDNLDNDMVEIEVEGKKKRISRLSAKELNLI